MCDAVADFELGTQRNSSAARSTSEGANSASTYGTRAKLWLFNGGAQKSDGATKLHTWLTPRAPSGQNIDKTGCVYVYQTESSCSSSAAAAPVSLILNLRTYRIGRARREMPAESRATVAAARACRKLRKEEACTAVSNGNARMLLCKATTLYATLLAFLLDPLSSAAAQNCTRTNWKPPTQDDVRDRKRASTSTPRDPSHRHPATDPSLADHQPTLI